MAKKCRPRWVTVFVSQSGRRTKNDESRLLRADPRAERPPGGEVREIGVNGIPLTERLSNCPAMPTDEVGAAPDIAASQPETAYHSRVAAADLGG